MINYAEYTNQELYEALCSIKADRYKDNYSCLVEALRARGYSVDTFRLEMERLLDERDVEETFSRHGYTMDDDDRASYTKLVPLVLFIVLLAVYFINGIRNDELWLPKTTKRLHGLPIYAMLLAFIAFSASLATLAIGYLRGTRTIRVVRIHYSLAFLYLLISLATVHFFAE